MQHPKITPSLVARGPRAGLRHRLALSCVVMLAALCQVQSAHAAPPSLTTFAWSGPASGEAQVGQDVTLHLVYGVANGQSGAITITAPPNTFIRSVAPAVGSSGASWAVTYNRVPSSDPWQTSATLTASGTSANVSGTLDVVITSRDGGFLNGQLVGFGATIATTNADGTTNGSASYDLRLLSAPSIAVTFGSAIQETYFGAYGGQLGTFRTYRFFLRESANGRADAGTTIAFTLPPVAQFLSTTIDSPTVPWVVTSAPAVGSSGVVNASYGFVRGTQGALTSTGALNPITVGLMDTSRMAVTYFVPCAALPANTSATGTLNATAYQAGSSPAYDRTATASSTTALAAASCNAPSVAKSLIAASMSAVPGETISYYMSASTAATFGTFPTNVVVVDRLPASVTYSDATLTGSPSSTSFALYLCAAPSSPGTFDYAAFDALRNAPTSGEHCRPQASFTGAASHVVAYAAEWKDPTAVPGEFGIRTVNLNISAVVNAGATSGSFVNRMCLHGAPGGASSPWSEAFAASYTTCTINAAGGPPSTVLGCGQACFSLTNATTPDVQVAIVNASNSASPLTYARGETMEFFVTARRLADNNLLFDPTLPSNAIRIQVPPGFNVVSAQQINACTPDVVAGGPEFSPTLTPNAGGTLVSFVPQQVLSVTNCGTANGATSAYGFKIVATVSTTYPFVAGATYPIVTDMNVANSSVTPSQTRTLNVLAPSELILELAGTTCTQAAIGGTATFTNQGGEQLSDVILDFEVPAGATFASAGVPVFYDTASLQSVVAAYAVSYIVNGVPQSALPGNLADVDAVRLTVSALAPYVRGDWPVTFTATLSQPSYTFIADVSDDAGHVTNDLQTFDTTGCPCTVNVAKTFTPAGGATAAMGGVRFELVGPFGYDVTHTTDAAGQIHVTDLAPGSYTLTEVTPTTSGGAELGAPFSGSWSTTFVVGAQATVDVEADNACTCPDEPCVVEGQCSWSAATQTASCNSTPTTCGEGTCGEVCDPVLDLCVAAEPVPCDQPGGRVIWGSVTLSDGTEKLFKCTVTGVGAPPTCEADPSTGVLILFDIDAGQCAQ